MYGTAAGAGAGQAIFTDDVSLQVFMEHLKRLVRLLLSWHEAVRADPDWAGCRGADRLRYGGVYVAFLRLLCSVHLDDRIRKHPFLALDH